MAARSIAAGAVAAALATTLVVAPTHALEVARITRHGYIVVDEPGAMFPYEGRVPVGSNEGLFGIISDLTALIDRTPDAPRGDYIAVMQLPHERSAVAFYSGLRNDTRGIGMRSPIGTSTRETYDFNPMLGTAFPITGFVFLNTIAFYTDPMLENFGRYLICTQEFGHRYGVHVRIPPRPGMPMPPPVDGGAEDAAVDAGGPDADLGPELAADALLGRQRAHWSYFVHTGGSPMEGNNWTEISPGVFRTGRVSFRFSPMDLYLMGLVPASAVPPFFVIAEPDVMGQRDMNGVRINRESPPEYGGNTVTIRGRRVDYTIDDIIRANGPRVPGYQNPDAGVADGGEPDAGPVADPDLRVIWVLLAQPEQVTDRLARDFDHAIEVCTGGYDEATGNRSHLVAQVAPMPDAGADAGTDAAADATAPPDADTSDARSGPVAVDAVGGCACSAPGRAMGTRDAAALLAVAAALAGVRRRRGDR
jgi:MYXO-CTERM domain-containing protein